MEHVKYYMNNPCKVIREINENYSEIEVYPKFVDDVEGSQWCSACMAGSRDGTHISHECEPYQEVIDYINDSDASMEDMLSKKRTRNLTRPRQMAMYIAREVTSMSLPEIGNAFGGRDHSTVIHACKTMEELKTKDNTTDSDYKTLIQTLRG
jgi:hypothetical protein